MNNKTALYLADYMKKQNLSADTVADQLAIPREKFTEAATEPLMADELLRLCSHLGVCPEVLVEIAFAK